jgi:membrane protease subunit HflK
MPNPQYPRDLLPEDLEQQLALLQERVQRWNTGKAASLAAVVIVALWLASGLYVVGPGERGVVMLFREAKEQTEPGLRYHLPWPIQSHIVVDVSQVRRAEIGFRTTDSSYEMSGRGGTRTVPQEALMLTGDENIVEVQLFVQYRVQDPVKFLFGAHDPENVLHTSAQVAMRSVVGQNTIDYTMTDGRLQGQEQIKSDLQKLLDAYQTGLLVTEARLLVVDPPAEVRDAFHDVVRALEDRERLVKEAEGYQEDVVPKARGEASQMVQQAEAYKAQRVIRAQGDANRFGAVLAEYEKAPAVTRDRLYIESMERVLPTMNKVILNQDGKNGVLPLLPLRGTPNTTTARELEKAAAATEERG